MKIINPEYHKVYTFSLNTHLTCDGTNLSQVLTAFLKKGSPAGQFAEQLVAHCLSDVAIHSPSKGYDLISKENGRKIEVKGQNHNGVDYSPSDMKGKGRKFNKERFDKESFDKDFITVDTTNISEGFSFVITPGADIVKLGHKLTQKHRGKIFGRADEATAVNW